MRAAPGPPLSQGRLRVDAAKAIAKLREYQLVDKTTWILEAIRAAVASKATAIRLAGDANDVWLSWQGPAWPPEQIPRLFDELVSPEPDKDHHHLRLMATAINTALGLDPAFVDVISIDEGGEGRAKRVRYKPDVLETVEGGEPGDSPLRKLAVETIAAGELDPSWPALGMVVHYRRRIGLGVLMMFARIEALPELRHAAEACTWIPVPLAFEDVTLSREQLGDDLVRVPLGEPIEGFAAIVDPSKMATYSLVMAEVAERGVVLSRFPIELPLLGRQERVPIRICIDAPRLPTNASRSEVRRDTHPLPLAEERAKLAVAPLVRALRDRLLADDAPRAVRDAAFALIAAACPLHTKLDTQTGAFEGIADLPLVRDACGERKPVAGTWRDLVHTGGSAYPAELSPWLGDVLWIPDGDPAARLVRGPIDRRALRRYVRWSRRQLRAKKDFDHAKRPSHVELDAEPRVRAQLGAALPGSCIDDARFHGVTGTICLVSTGLGGEVILLLEGRELDRVRIKSKLEIAAIVDDPRLTPGDRYRSVVRDDAFLALESIVLDGAVRAAEAIALNLAGAPVPHGFEVAPLDPSHDVAIVRNAIGTVANLPDGSPLAAAAIWSARPDASNIADVADLADDHPTSLVEIRAQKIVALASPGVYVPPGRLVLQDVRDRLVFAKLAPDTRFVTYDQIAGSESSTATLPFISYERPKRTVRLEGGDLATMLLSTCEHALAIPGEGARMRGAIGIGAQDSAIFHAGISLHRWKYTDKLMPVVLAIEHDDAIPAESWDMIEDDAGITQRNFEDWEVQLARAIARALVDERDSALLGGPLGVESNAARALFASFEKRPPGTLLGTELAAKLRSHPLLRLLGDEQRRSIDELPDLFPWGVTYVAEGHGPEPGFTAIIASAQVAAAVAALAGCASVDGEPELAKLVVKRQRDARLASHLARPEGKVELPYETPRIQLQTATARGQVGVSHGGLEIHVFVERRMFEVIRRPDELHVIAAVDISADRANETFEALPPQTVGALVDEVLTTVPALLERIAATEPALIGDPGHVRKLLATWLAKQRSLANSRSKLRNVVAFTSVQGGRVSIKQATRVDILAVGNWHQEWLAADRDVHPTLDAPILLVDNEELRDVLRVLHDGTMQDLTDELAKLQAQRQMARGLLPVPKVPGSPPFVRTFLELGETDPDLGFGEIALVDSESSMVFLHVRGELRERVVVDIQPSVHIAIEAPELVTSASEQLLADMDMQAHPVQRISRKLSRLVEKLVAEVVKGTPPPALVGHLRRAVLVGSLDGTQVLRAPIWNTVDGGVVDFATVAAQRDRFGIVWVVPEATAERPLDEQRLVFLFTPQEIEIATKLKIIDARRELAIDAKARKNRDRPRATSLIVPPGITTLTVVELEGDGITAPRGYVAALAPDAAQRRMIYAHREMHPFDGVADPCQWPTVAVIDDARLVPDRLWQGPEGGPIWHEVLSSVRAASDRSLAGSVTIPTDVLAVERLTNLSHDGLPSLKGNTKTRIRGALWIAARAPRSRDPVPPIRVVSASGEMAYTLEQSQALTGTLYVHAPDGFHEDTLRELCAGIHTRLVRGIVTNRALDADLVRAHALHALAMSRVYGVDVRNVTFDCFAPTKLDANGWLDLLHRRVRVPIVKPGELPTQPSIVDDGTEASRVAQAWCDLRVTFAPPGTPPVTRASTLPPIPPPPMQTVRSAQPNAPTRPATPLEELALRVVQRLVAMDVPRPAWELVSRAEPIIAYNEGLEFADEHPQLRAIAAAQLAGSAWATAALDALAAHALTILNVSLTQVTDATEINGLTALLDAS